jgi:hypothetical protein
MAIKDIFKKKNKVTPEFIEWWEENFGSGRRNFYLVKGFRTWWEDMSYINGTALVWFRTVRNGKIEEHTYCKFGDTEQEIIRGTYYSLRLYNHEYMTPHELETYLEELKITSNEKKN